MLDPTAMILADRATKHHLMSARPDAPIAPERPPRAGHTQTVRRSTAALLRLLADRVEPRHAESCVTTP